MESPHSALAINPACSADGLEATLEQILAEPVVRVQQRQHHRLHELLAVRNGRCVLFGAGNLGRRALTALRSIRIHPLALSDNNPDLWGNSIDGVPILPPDIAADRYGGDAHFFITIRNEDHWYRGTFDQLSDLGCAHLSGGEPIAWRFPEIFPPFLLYDLPHKLYQRADCLRLAAQLWADDASRAEYLAQVRLRALGDAYGLSKPATEESYFLDGVFDSHPDDTFVDCGAFDGDTIRALVERHPGVGRIDAIEADRRSFDRLAGYVATLESGLRHKIRLHPCAVGSHHGTVRFENSGKVDSKISTRGGIEVDMVPLDIMFATTPMSMIKMDIEGGEFDALLGASHVIQRDRPILAVCVYHSQEDLWRLPLLMRSMCPEYQMYLKSYRGDGIQTVAYAVPPGRVLEGEQTGKK